MTEFRFFYRNPGHWDVYSEIKGRIYSIRGNEKDKFFIRQENKQFPYTNERFDTAELAATWVLKQLMGEIDYAP